MFEKIYKNKQITEKYYKKYKILNNLSNKEFNIPKVIKIENNKIFFEKINNFDSLNKFQIDKIDFKKIGEILFSIHNFLGNGKVNNKQYIHGDYCLQNILKTKNNEYYIIDFESPKEYEDGDIYFINNPYLDLGIFIMKLITSKPIYQSFFTSYNKEIINFLDGYNSKIDKKLLLKYIDMEFNRFLKGIKNKSIIRYILWKIYLIISKYKLLKIWKNT